MKQAIFVPMHPNMPSSLDPLDADRHENLPVARMIYSTPIEVSHNNSLVSQILSSFTYSPEERLMTWVLRPGMTFDDGSSVTADDIAFSVARIAFSRPDFPVIREIEGLKSWLETKAPLKTFPSGIFVSDNTIHIKFKSVVKNPFFRFTLELFSIIPRSCVEANTNKILCRKIPTSGNYIISRKTQREIEFSLRVSPSVGHGMSSPNKIIFRYEDVNTLKHDADGIFQLSEFSLKLRKIDLKDRGFSYKSAPSADFISILISPLRKPFDRPDCRMLFANTVRKVLIEEIGSDISAEASLFPKIISGYLPNEKLASNLPINDLSCLEYMRSHPIAWARFPKKDGYFFDDLVEKVAKRLGLQLMEPIILSSSGDEWPKLFNLGQVSFYPFMTGFWAMDPMGDVRMLFTPNLHEDLYLISKDRQLQTLLSDLDKTPEGESTRLKMEEINRYMHSQAIMNPIFQFKRMYASKNSDDLHEFPYAVQQPYPWQVFGD